MPKKYWLMKTEPNAFSFDDLLLAKNQTEGWDGIRNYQARNFMRDDFQKGDHVFIYHSNTDVPSIVGQAEVVSDAYPDVTAMDPKAKYFDAKSAEKGESRWVQVDVKAYKRFSEPVSLKEMREVPGLEKMLLLKKGMRLSIQKVEKSEWVIINKLGRPKAL